MLIPADSAGENIKITVPDGLMDSEDISSSNIRKVRKCIQRLNKQKVSFDSFGDVKLGNGRVLKGINYSKAIRNHMLGVQKKKYAEFNELLI